MHPALYTLNLTPCTLNQTDLCGTAQWGGGTGAWPRRVEGVGARAVEVVAGEAHCVVRCDDGTLFTWDVSLARTEEAPRARFVQGLPAKCVAVAAGGNTTMALVESDAGNSQKCEAVPRRARI